MDETPSTDIQSNTEINLTAQLHLNKGQLKPLTSGSHQSCGQKRPCSLYEENSMPANFTSGWLGNNEVAWHGMGVVTEGTLPAREAFSTADALFTVEKRELFYPSAMPDPTGIGGLMEYKPSGTYGVVRTDTQALLGVVSKQYEIVQNESLLRMAEFIREEVDMDCVIVLSDGAKVCFTATLRGAETDIVPGDTVKRRIVGYLGHDGKTGCGAKFTNIRVVCQNTLTAALTRVELQQASTTKVGLTRTSTNSFRVSMLPVKTLLLSVT